MLDLNKSKSAIAIAYTQYGLSLLPVHGMDGKNCTCRNPNCTSKAKHPWIPNGVHAAMKDAKTLVVNFSGMRQNANIGVACGEASGIWVLDVDDMDALKRLEDAHEPLPKTWTCETGKGGRHFYFRFNENCKLLKNRIGFAGKIDIRATNGYVLLPPSMHASGKPYRWLISPDECELADAPEWLLSLSLDDKPKTQTLTQTIIVTSGETSLEARAKAYLAKCPPAISGQGGSNTAFANVTQLFRAIPELHALADDDILRLLEEWNSRCVPLWSDSELLHKIRDGRAKTQPESVSETKPVPSSESVSVTSNDRVWPTLESDAYQGLLGDIVKTIDPETEADAVGVLLSLLAGTGNAIGNGPYFNVGATRHHANLFCALVGPTSAGKGQAWDVARYVLPATWKAECICSGVSSGEGLIERLSDPMDGESGVFTIPEPKRLFVVETEFDRPVKAMRRDGNTLSAILRSAFDGGTLEVMVRGNAKLRASNAYVSILVHVTPEELQKILTGSVEVTNGFANRFLWTLVRSEKCLPHGGNISVLNPFRERLQNAIEVASSIGEVRRDAEADRLWESVYPSLKESKPGAWGKATERGRPLVMRLAMVYALVDGQPIIKVAHLKAALAVWRYCEASAEMIFGNVDVSSTETLAKRLQRIVSEKPGITRRDLQRSVSHRVSPEAFAETISALVSAGGLVVETVGRSECFHVGTGDGGHSRPVSVQQNIVGTGDGGQSAVPSPSVPVSPVPVSPAELFDWRNSNGKDFYWRDDGIIWVTDETGLTPAIAAAIHANQDMLKLLAKSDPIENDPFYQELLNPPSSINVDAEAFLEEIKQARAAASET